MKTILAIIVIAAIAFLAFRILERPAPAPEARQDALPAAVANKRDRIRAAAAAGDYDALAALADDEQFTFSFGGGSDFAAFLRERAEAGESPQRIIPAVLSTEPERIASAEGDIYVWPGFFLREPAAWTPADIEAMRTLATEEQIEQYRQFGGYAGYRIGIRENGDFIYYVAGD